MPRVAAAGKPTAKISKSQNTKARVLHEALALASRIGFQGLSFGTLAAHARLSKSGLFAHFHSKEDLQIRTLELASAMFVERVLKPAVAAPRGVPRIRRLFDGWMAWIRSDSVPSGDILISCAFEFDDAPPGPMRDAVVRGHHALQSTIERLARQALEAGQLAPRTDPAQFAFEFLGIVHAHHHLRRLLGTDPRARRARLAFERLLRDHAAQPHRRRAAR
ncbi:MAG: TetR/AcrR family transcriptional regulator [Betaproteobacteria bacterium]|nr:TetR/AcrR family transcriptional regulator [Betaproteobacteria bacterium]